MSFLLFITTILCTIATTIWRGFVITHLWAWFVVSTFGLAPLTIVQAIGLSLIVAFLTFQYIHDSDKENFAEKLVGAMVFSFIWPAMCLLIGYIVQLFL